MSKQTITKLAEISGWTEEQAQKVVSLMVKAFKEEQAREFQKKIYGNPTLEKVKCIENGCGFYNEKYSQCSVVNLGDIESGLSTISEDLRRQL